MDLGSVFKKLIEAGYQQQNVKYAFVASLAFVLADAIHCFPLEVKLIWGSKWNMGKVLYLLSRYLVFVTITIPEVYNLSSNLSVEQCRLTFASGSVMVVVVVTVSEAILFLRVYALGGRSRAIGMFLAILYLGIHSAVFASLAKFILSIEYGASPLPAIISCFPIKSNNKLLSIVFILLLVSELVILIMTFWLCFAKHQSTKSPLVATFYKDGLFYFLLLSAVSTGNIICNLVAPLPYIYLLAIPQMVLHSALSTRMVLHIRKLGNGVYDTKGEIPLTSLDLSGSESTTKSMRFAAKATADYDH
ncbi:hypothetical protein DFP72DRAFT_888061 [Ephemerocybe angulata]|uniref:DUF6533 domain-containing protein n=1 Tax=Ephemerocybe angulata TaxID=980116 RepID=A0A8H6I4F8_9AGAR|nr:hypothetical protein DFP72DRAFT_888061 [Tulosesus angulatus]